MKCRVRKVSAVKGREIRLKVNCFAAFAAESWLEKKGIVKFLELKWLEGQQTELASVLP